jgi:energy-coupling factor transporter ATP-binding protein EcfA2
MLKGMKLRNLTVFADADLRFAAGLNMVVGANGTGKSHLLKAAYTVVAVSARGEKESGSAVPRKSYLESALAKKLRGVFRPDELGRLARRQAGRSRCEVAVSFKPKSEIAFSFNTSRKTEVTVDTLPTVWEDSPPVFLPTRELLTIYLGFVSLYETTDLPFEETWRDTCILLGAPLAKGARLGEIRTLLDPLESTLGGKVDFEDRRFYVRTGAGNMEAHLLA